MAGPTSTVELAVPKPVGAVIGATVLIAFLLSSICLVIYNLLNWMAIIPSIIWLLLVGTVLIGLGKSTGHKQFATEILGAFSFKQFVQTIRRENSQNEIQFGYQMFGYRFLYLTVPVEKIDHVHWSTGQASHMAKRDMNDWSVAIWYEHGDPVKSPKQHWMRHPDQEDYIVGPQGRKREIENFGRTFVEFLQKSGAILVQGENECTFVRQIVATQN